MAAYRTSPGPVNENAGSHGKQVTIQMLDWRSRHLTLHSEKDLLHKVVYLAGCNALREITTKPRHMRFVGGLLRVSDCPLRRCTHRTPHLASTERIFIRSIRRLWITLHGSILRVPREPAPHCTANFQ